MKRMQVVINNLEESESEIPCQGIKVKELTGDVHLTR